LLVAACLAACGSGDSGNSRRSPYQKNPRPEIEAPVFLLAVDGFEWSAILPLLAEGRMPALAALIERGMAGKLRPLRPTLSPRLWATIATGKLPHLHGIEDFLRKVDGRDLAYTSFDRKVKAFWNILSEYGVSSDTIGWWTTYPAEQVYGTMVAQVNTTDADRRIEKGTVVEGAPDQVWPPEENARVLEILREVEATIPQRLHEIFGDFQEYLDEGQLDRWRQCEWAFRADAVYAAIVEDRLRRGLRADVTSLYIGGTDVVGHRFWAARWPEEAGLDPDGVEVRAFGHVVSAYYEWVDQVLGRLLALFPPETTVLVVADHGMALNVEALREGRLDEFTGIHFADEPGALVAAGTGIATVPGRSRASELGHRDLPLLGGIYDVCPTLLVLMGVPIGMDMHGRPLRSILDMEFIARHPPQRIATHDDADWIRSRQSSPEIEEAAERLEQLRNLGYR
jgi:predicted AlkP superfamily phosphohydrolase/phosphomutase